MRRREGAGVRGGRRRRGGRRGVPAEEDAGGADDDGGRRPPVPTGRPEIPRAVGQPGVPGPGERGADTREDGGGQQRADARVPAPGGRRGARAATRREDAAAGLGGGRCRPRRGVGGGWRAVGPTHKQRYAAVRRGGKSRGGGVESAGRRSTTRKAKPEADAAGDESRRRGRVDARGERRSVPSEPFARLLTALTVCAPPRTRARRAVPPRAGLHRGAPRHSDDGPAARRDDVPRGRRGPTAVSSVGLRRGRRASSATSPRTRTGDAATDEVYDAAGNEEDEDELLSVQRDLQHAVSCTATRA